MSANQTETIKRRYNRTARYYDMMDRMINSELRIKAISQARGKVLEVGVGTGANLAFYQPGCEVTAIDFSPAMLAKARTKVPLARVPVTLVEMDAQEMQFEDNTFDTVLATCVFCSVPDPVQGLREVRRVCKPGGQIILLEHVRSENAFLGTLMDFFNPVSLYLIGSNINRRTLDNIAQAQIRPNKIESQFGKILNLIIAEP